LRLPGVRHRGWGGLARLWLPVLAWASLIFALSSVPDLGTGLGGWDLLLRKLAHAAEYAVLGALLVRATARPRLATVLGTLYAASDELHQSLVPGRMGSPLDVAIDAVGVVVGAFLWHRLLARRGVVTQAPALAVDLDGVLGDTRPLWEAWLGAAADHVGLAAGDLPSDRGEAAAELDRRGAGNWRALLERFSEERAPVYLRRDSATSATLRLLADSGRVIGVFTDAPEPLARVALAQLGGERRVTALEAGDGALERLLSRLGDDAVVLRRREDLQAVAESAPVTQSY